MSQKRLTQGEIRGVLKRRKTGGRFKLRVQRRGRQRKGRFVGANQELKFFDTNFADAIVAGTGAIVTTLVNIAQGITESTRVGRKCVIRSIGFRFDVTLSLITAAGAPQPSDVIRVILYQDKQANGAAIGVSGASGILQAADYQAFLELTNRKRVVTLMDRSYPLNYAAQSGVSGSINNPGVVISDSFYKRVNIPIEYSGASGAITEIRSNNIGALLITKGGDAGFIGTIRMRFSDN